MKLIINADDFGLSEGQNYGIIKAHTHGIVCSCSLMVNQQGFTQAISLLKQHPTLKAGLHFVLTFGKPISNAKIIPSLLQNGKFRKPKESFINSFDIKELETEMQAQIDKFLSTGLKFNHFDCHHNALMYQPIFEIYMKLAEKYQVPVRFSFDEATEYHNSVIKKYPKVKLVAKVNTFYQDNISENYFVDFKDNYQQYELIDLMCHPAYLDDYILNNSSYNIHRVKELQVLTSKKVQELLEKQQIILTNYTDM